MMKSNTLEIASKETTRLLDVQSDALTKALAVKGFLNASVEKEIKKWINNIENDRDNLEKNRMVLGVIGTMKAGKSTTINAIVGMEILPNRETAMTTLPTLILNKHGQIQPVLKIKKIKPLLDLSRSIVGKLKQLKDSEKKELDLRVNEDIRTLIVELIQKGEYPFKTEYNGQKEIFDFLKHLNDIMRLAKAIKINIDPYYDEYQNAHELPVIEVEFCHLKGMQGMANGNLAILDTPGPNECGQSEALKRVMKTQLSKVSAVLLVVDFTQMNTDAEAGVREELSIIEDQLSNNRLSILVNKFDNVNANTSKKEGVKKSVTNLMNDKVDATRIFPASSYLAYLANRAKGHLEHNDTLPSPENEPWVADFAVKAFGECWDEKDINGIEKVKTGIQKLWEKSSFKEPIEKVIKEAHATAANLVLDAAIKNLEYYHSEFSNILNIRLMDAELGEINKMVAGLSEDIENCKLVEGKVHDGVQEKLLQLNEAMDEVMKAQAESIQVVIDRFFADGQRMEAAMQKQMLNAVLEKRDKNRNLRNILVNVLTRGVHDKLIKKEIEEKFIQKPNPDLRTISFDSKYEAEKYIEKIKDGVADIFKNADDQIKETAKDFIQSTTATISQEIDKTVAQTLEKARDKLGNVELNFTLPDINLSSTEVNVSAIFNEGYDSSTEHKTGRRRASGAWGTVCKWFGTRDNGWEEYSYSETSHAVDLRKVKQLIDKQLDELKSTHSDRIGEFLENELQTKIDNHLNVLVEYLERYRGLLNQNASESESAQKQKEKNRAEASKNMKIKIDSSVNEASNSEWKIELAPLLKNQETIKGDIEAINSAV